MQVTVRDAELADSAALAPLARTALIATYSPIAQPAVYEAVIAQTCTVSAFNDAIELASRTSNAHFLVAEREEDVVGFLDFGLDDEGLGVSTSRSARPVAVSDRCFSANSNSDFLRALGTGQFAQPETRAACVFGVVMAL
jgi:hypothetical protein